MDNLTKAFAEAIVQEYKVYSDYCSKPYCRFCGAYTTARLDVDRKFKEYEIVWHHEDSCVVPKAEEVGKNS